MTNTQELIILQTKAILAALKVMAVHHPEYMTIAKEIDDINSLYELNSKQIINKEC